MSRRMEGELGDEGPSKTISKMEKNQRAREIMVQSRNRKTFIVIEG